MNILQILPRELYKFHYDGDLQKIFDYIVKLSDQDHKRFGLLYETAANNPVSVMDIHVPEFAKEFKDIYKFMMNSVEEVINHLKFQHPDFFMQQVWTNLHWLPDQGHIRHVHPNSIFSSIFNVRCLPPNNVTTFHGGTPSGDEDAVMLQHVYTNEQFPDGTRLLSETSDGARYELLQHQPGDFTVFRSDIAHSVPNFNNQGVGDLRVSASANFWLSQMGRTDRATYLRVKPDYDHKPPAGYDRGTGWENDKRLQKEKTTGGAPHSIVPRELIEARQHDQSIQQQREDTLEGEQRTGVEESNKGTTK